MELLLNDCSITYIPKDSKKKKHELKISHQGADALVLAVQSKEQAEQWLKVRGNFWPGAFSPPKHFHCLFIAFRQSRPLKSHPVWDCRNPDLMLGPWSSSLGNHKLSTTQLLWVRMFFTANCTIVWHQEGRWQFPSTYISSSLSGKLWWLRFPNMKGAGTQLAFWSGA